MMQYFFKMLGYAINSSFLQLLGHISQYTCYLLLVFFRSVLSDKVCLLGDKLLDFWKNGLILDTYEVFW